MKVRWGRAGEKKKNNNLSETKTLQSLNAHEASKDKHQERKPSLGLLVPCLNYVMNYHYSGTILVAIRATFGSLDRLSLCCSLQKDSE